MEEPSSFCTICTYNCHHEFFGLLYSLSFHHQNATIYCMVDSKTKDEYDILTVKPKLNVIFYVELDEYTGLNRQQMTHMKIWDNFQMKKSEIIDKVLTTENDTMFLDSDILVLNKMKIINHTKKLGLSPHFVKKNNTDEVGFYNGGCIWTNCKNVPELWRKYTKTSRYFDQASLEDVAREYKDTMFEFGEEVNFMPWRIIIGDDPEETKRNIQVKNNNIFIKDKPLVFLHTHFLDPRFKEVNSIFIEALKTLKRHRELMIIDRIMHDKWVIRIPKQPLPGIWRHKNDSFRELALLFQKHNYDVKVEYNQSGHCWLSSTIVLYDRISLQWFNQELPKSSLLLLGNGDVEVEGKQLQTQGVIVSPWIFWPRKPLFIEMFMDKNERNCYEKRPIKSIFIGNIENSVQNKYLNTDQRWNDVLDEFHCTNGTTHKFSPFEYIKKLSQSKYGLCLRGDGSKCHREIELLALGTVPIVTDHVTTTSYINPLVENVHYIKVSTPEMLTSTLDNITEDQWNAMSINGVKWYRENVHSKQAMKTTLKYLLYS